MRLAESKIAARGHTARACAERAVTTGAASSRSGAVIPLARMSDRQRRLIERHLPLVRLTLRRLGPLWRGRADRDADELFQEGCLALVRAIQTHDPRRHGAFATYAMARVHFAMSAFAHEFTDLIRVPFSAQRRRRSGPRRGYFYVPRTCTNFTALGDVAVAAPSAAEPGSASAGASAGGTTVGELVRERLEETAHETLARLAARSRGNEAAEQILRRCMDERWMVPDSAFKTSLRELADSMKCSLGRISHSESRFHRNMAKALRADARFRRLARLARAHPAGMERRLTEAEAARIRGPRAAGRKADPRG